MPENRGINRRTFLMGALATAAAPAFFQSAAHAAGGPNDRILLGCIGVGRMGRTDMQEAIFRGLEHNARVVAVCDVDSKRLELGKQLVEECYEKEAERAGKVPQCKTYSDFRELLARPDIDGVLITTPDHWHGAMAFLAAQARKDMYLEKPATNTIAEGRALVAAIHDNRRIAQVGSQQRSTLYFRKACELVRNGRIGQLRTIRVTLPEDKGTGNNQQAPVPPNLNYPMWMGPTADAPYVVDRAHPQDSFERPGWIQSERYCLGMITGWGSHMHDIAQWGNNTDDTGLVEIEAKGDFPDRGSFDVHTKYHAEGKWANGVKLISESGSAGVRFEGESGWIFVSREKLEASDPRLLKWKPGKADIRLYESKSHMGNFFQCMRSRKAPVASIDIGHRSNSISIITHIAMKTGRKLRWDPKTERFIDDDKANEMLDYKHRAPWELVKAESKKP